MKPRLCCSSYRGDGLVIEVRVQCRDLVQHPRELREWLESRDIRVVGFGGKLQRVREVLVRPYGVHDSSGFEMVGYKYHFTDDLREEATLFKLTWSGVNDRL